MKYIEIPTTFYTPVRHPLSLNPGTKLTKRTKSRKPSSAPTTLCPDPAHKAGTKPEAAS